MSQYKGDNTTGFQSPAQDYVEGVVDLAAILDLRRPGRYPVRVKGQALAARGIHDGDILVADAASDPKPGKVCVAMVGGDVILAVLTKRNETWQLQPSSGPIITIEDDVEVWAIVEALVRTRP
ncbi:MAG TPA: S24 family peptidase [Hyphomonadaceae bacterium]|jgi:SOS-response transcriptional repressor LexA|nr:S24 family peptidase [Hyphomonadaceae bacterium]